MSMIDLKFDYVSKRYRVVQEDPEDGGARHPLVRKLRSLRRRPRDFWAVRDVSFEVPRGEALGIIGHNGAGKSTVLKLLSNITSPTSGEITIHGRLSALIEVGSGFHPELTGRENIYLSGSILGMRRREITEKLDSIVDFAELRQFIDTPVKRYSSGMYVRLGFSIAAHLDPDILLLDEVLAVGDASFQAKCLQRITELKQAGKTIVFISHDLSAVEQLCDRVLLMQRGEIIAGGPPREVIAEYQRATTNFVPSAPPRTEIENLPQWARVTNLSFCDAVGREAAAFCTGEPLTVRVEYEAHEPVADAVFEVFFYSQDEWLQCQLTTESSGGRIDLEPGRGAVEFFCPELSLLPGAYLVDLTIVNRGALAGTAIDWQFRCATLCVDKGKAVRGGFYMSHNWQFKRLGGAGGSRAEVIKLYSPPPASQDGGVLRFLNLAPDPGLQFEVERVEILDRDGKLKPELSTGDYARFRIVWRSATFVAEGGVELGIYTLNGTPLIRYSNQPVSGTDVAFHLGANYLDLEFQQFPLAAGQYRLGVGLSLPMVEWLYRNDNFAILSLKEKDYFQSGYILDASYSVLTVPHRWITHEQRAVVDTDVECATQ